MTKPALIPIEGPEKATKEWWMGANQNSFARTGLCPKINPKAKTLQESDEHTNQQHRNNPLKVMNAAEKEWDQLDTRLARYDKNSEQTLLLKLPDGHVRP
jgi:hypothetical protein